MISVITVTYNSLPTLKEAYESLLAQEFHDWEWVLQDGSSTDGTIEWLTTLNDPRIAAQSEKDAGIYDALNKAITRAKGQLIGMLHADDLYPHAQVLTLVAEEFEKGADGVYGDLNYVREHDIQKVLRHWKSCAFYPALLNKGWMPAHPTLFLKRDIYDQVGYFNTRYRIASDYDFILRVFSKPAYTFSYLPSTLMLMRYGGASSKWKNLITKSKEDLHIMRSNRMRFPMLIVLRKISSKFKQFLSKDKS
jgi:glycosyltransferase